MQSHCFRPTVWKNEQLVARAEDAAQLGEHLLAGMKPWQDLSNANQAWWNTMVTPGLMRYKQKDQNFEAILGYITSLRPTKLHEELLTPPHTHTNKTKQLWVVI